MTPTSRQLAFQNVLSLFVGDHLSSGKAKSGKPGKKPKNAEPPRASREECADYLLHNRAKASTLRMATHISKGIHSQIPTDMGADVHVHPASLPAHDGIGTHSLAGGAFTSDSMSGNQAGMRFGRLLSTNVEGRSFLSWIEERDADMLAALHPDPACAQAIADALTVPRAPADAPVVSSRLFKQIYWLDGDDVLDDAGYRLLQPLYPSTLQQALHDSLKGLRFDKTNSDARTAFRKREAFDGLYSFDPGVASVRLGGQNPQNVSCLNGKGVRWGIGFNLASLPPRWRTDTVTIPRNTVSVFPAFFRLRRVRGLLAGLAELLKSPTNNHRVRSARERYEDALSAELAAFASSYHLSLPAGWSAHGECVLAPAEKVWLDPGREDLGDLACAYDWQDDVASTFARGVISHLHKRGVIGLGDSQFRYLCKRTFSVMPKEDTA